MRKESRMFLKAIRDNTPLPSTVNIDRIPEATTENLREQYKRKKAELLASGWNGKPPNMPFYYIAVDKYPGLFPGNRVTPNMFEDLRVNVDTLLAFDLYPILREHFPLEPILEPKPSQSGLPIELIKDLYALYEKTKVSFPDKSWELRVFEWIYKGLNRQQLTVLSPVCPDYSYKLTGGKARYTFDKLGNGVGIVARKVLKVLPDFIQFCIKHKLPVQMWIGMADFEALDPENCKLLEITREVFLKRVEESRLAIEHAAPRGVHVVMCTERSGGQQRWKDMKAMYEQRFQANDFGASKLDEAGITRILEKRQSIFRRWYGERREQIDYLPQLYSQGAHCAGVATIASAFPNCLIFEVGSSAMSGFYDVSGELPALFIKSNY